MWLFCAQRRLNDLKKVPFFICFPAASKMSDLLLAAPVLNYHKTTFRELKQLFNVNRKIKLRKGVEFKCYNYVSTFDSITKLIVITTDVMPMRLNCYKNR